MSIPQTSRKEGSKSDICLTPPELITQVLVPLLPKDLVIWEPAASEAGLIAWALRKAGYLVIESDLTYGPEFDFLTYEPGFDFDIIITNPPFTLDYKFVKRCYQKRWLYVMLMKDNVDSSARFKDAAWRQVGEFYTSDYQRIMPSSRTNFHMPDAGWFTEEEKTGRYSEGQAQFMVFFYTNFLEFNGHKDISVPYRQINRYKLFWGLFSDALMNPEQGSRFTEYMHPNEILKIAENEGLLNRSADEIRWDLDRGLGVIEDKPVQWSEQLELF